MVKYLTQHGNSAALVIDKPIMELLNIQIGTPLEISTDGRVEVELTPYDLTKGRISFRLKDEQPAKAA
jgi:antitoxin component of MazEF toxin-antitoxin module